MRNRPPGLSLTETRALAKLHGGASQRSQSPITGWRYSREEQTQDFATARLYYVLRQQHYTQWSQELRGAGKIGHNFDYVVGGYYSDSHYDLTQWTAIGLGYGLDTASNPSAVAPGEHDLADGFHIGILSCLAAAGG